MSMPIICKHAAAVDRCQAVNDLIESVALIETGLSHIINAEGEKIQKVLEYDSCEVTICEIIEVNDSVAKMISAISRLEMMLQSKLETVIELDTGC